MRDSSVYVIRIKEKEDAEIDGELIFEDKGGEFLALKKILNP